MASVPAAARPMFTSSDPKEDPFLPAPPPVPDVPWAHWARPIPLAELEKRLTSTMADPSFPPGGFGHVYGHDSHQPQAGYPHYWQHGPANAPGYALPMSQHVPTATGWRQSDGQQHQDRAPAPVSMPYGGMHQTGYGVRGMAGQTVTHAGGWEMPQRGPAPAAFHGSTAAHGPPPGHGYPPQFAYPHEYHDLGHGLGAMPGGPRRQQQRPARHTGMDRELGGRAGLQIAGEDHSLDSGARKLIEALGKPADRDWLLKEEEKCRQLVLEGTDLLRTHTEQRLALGGAEPGTDGSFSHSVPSLGAAPAGFGPAQVGKGASGMGGDSAAALAIDGRLATRDSSILNAYKRMLVHKLADRFRLRRITFKGAGGGRSSARGEPAATAIIRLVFSPTESVLPEKSLEELELSVGYVAPVAPRRHFDLSSASSPHSDVHPMSDASVSMSSVAGHHSASDTGGGMVHRGQAIVTSPLVLTRGIAGAPPAASGPLEGGVVAGGAGFSHHAGYHQPHPHQQGQLGRMPYGDLSAMRGERGGSRDDAPLAVFPGDRRHYDQHSLVYGGPSTSVARPGPPPASGGLTTSSHRYAPAPAPGAATGGYGPLSGPRFPPRARHSAELDVRPPFVHAGPAVHRDGGLARDDGVGGVVAVDPRDASLASSVARHLPGAPATAGGDGLRYTMEPQADGSFVVRPVGGPQRPSGPRGAAGHPGPVTWAMVPPEASGGSSRYEHEWADRSCAADVDLTAAAPSYTGGALFGPRDGDGGGYETGSVGDGGAGHVWGRGADEAPSGVVTGHGSAHRGSAVPHYGVGNAPGGRFDLHSPADEQHLPDPKYGQQPEMAWHQPTEHLGQHSHPASRGNGAGGDKDGGSAAAGSSTSLAPLSGTRVHESGGRSGGRGQGAGAVGGYRYGVDVASARVAGVSPLPDHLSGGGSDAVSLATTGSALTSRPQQQPLSSSALAWSQRHHHGLYEFAEHLGSGGLFSRDEVSEEEADGVEPLPVLGGTGAGAGAGTGAGGGTGTGTGTGIGAGAGTGTGTGTGIGGGGGTQVSPSTASRGISVIGSGGGMPSGSVGLPGRGCESDSGVSLASSSASLGVATRLDDDDDNSDDHDDHEPCGISASAKHSAGGGIASADGLGRARSHFSGYLRHGSTAVTGSAITTRGATASPIAPVSRRIFVPGGQQRQQRQQHHHVQADTVNTAAADLEKLQLH